MIGYTTCLTAGLARQWMLSPDQPDIQPGIQSGLAAMRTLHLEGYGERGVHRRREHAAGLPDRGDRRRLGRASRRPSRSPRSRTRCASSSRRQRAPTAPDRRRASGPSCRTATSAGLDQVAMQVVLEGPEAALQGVPWGSSATC